jgi:subtilisin family serine protease
VALAGLVVAGAVAANGTAASAAGPGGNRPGRGAATAMAAELALVRFEPGTPAEGMRAAVANAGGEVLDSSLAELGVAVVKPARADFASRVRRGPRVLETWRPTFVSYQEREPGSARTGRPMPPLFGREVADPLHDAPSFWGETNPRGILQWDDRATNVTAAWPVTTGDPTVTVAVIDSGVDTRHRELAGVVQAAYSVLPCGKLARMFGSAVDLYRDCALEDGDGHGTWVASRIAGALNGFGSNGIAPRVAIVSYKALSASLGGGATAWIADAMVRACRFRSVDLVNLSLGTYDDPTDPDGVQDYLLWTDAVDYCLRRGVGVVAAGGNDHVRVDRADVTVGGRALQGVGRVSPTAEGYGFQRHSDPGDPQPGFLLAPGGVPGVLMVSATNNATAPPDRDVPSPLRPPEGAQGRLDQLAYYSNYGSRVDVAAPGGARKFNLPRSDGGPGNILYGGWGLLGATSREGLVCQADGGPADFACFDLFGETLAWLQGSSMAAPEATGIAALALSAHPELRGRPAALVSHLRATARAGIGNATPPLSPTDSSADASGAPCPAGYCHLDWSAPPISDAAAYGAGLLDAAAAVR